MLQTIQPLIDLANTDLDLQTSVFSRSHLARQIETARSVVDQHQKLFEQKNNVHIILRSNCLVKNVTLRTNPAKATWPLARVYHSIQPRLTDIRTT